MQSITILGATGSIGVNTLNVIRLNRTKFTIFALTAHNNVKLLAEQCIEFKPKVAVVSTQEKADALRLLIAHASLHTEVLFGPKALVDVAESSQVDTVMAAIVGGAGLMPAYAAANSGKRVLLANKEALVMSGSLFTQAVARTGGILLPVDSEHNAIFQCLPEDYQSPEKNGLHKIILTGSGGPFRDESIANLSTKTPSQACAHPNWDMGRKISVDSATMMNKGLEFIEACWLFHAKPSDIEVIIHPQSIIHSMVQYKDGTTLAQMGTPDMATPIAHCLSYPSRIESGAKHLDFSDISALSFYQPNYERYPSLKLAIDCFDAGSSHAAVLNAANEIAVEAFLDGVISFTDIAVICEKTLNQFKHQSIESIEHVLSCDRESRLLASKLLDKGIN
jgi:1-deoxy-D-xylulose-5-phosphate reductoisomerase